MHPYIKLKAEELVRYDLVEIVMKGFNWNRIHFIIDGLDGNKVDVWRIETAKGVEFHCNAKNPISKFSCCLVRPFRSTPECVHTLAAELYYKNKWRKE